MKPRWLRCCLMVVDRTVNAIGQHSSRSTEFKSQTSDVEHKWDHGSQQSQHEEQRGSIKLLHRRAF